jgi:hypothetical protein
VIHSIPKSQDHAIGLWSLQSVFAEVVPGRSNGLWLDM